MPCCDYCAKPASVKDTYGTGGGVICGKCRAAGKHLAEPQDPTFTEIQVMRAVLAGAVSGGPHPDSGWTTITLPTKTLDRIIYLLDCLAQNVGEP